MRVIQIKEKDNVIGYFCGLFTREGEKQIGYEEDSSARSVRKYKTIVGAQRIINEVNEVFPQNDPYTFEIVEK